MVAGGRFQAEKERALSSQMKDQFLESFSVHCGSEEEDLLSLLSDTACIKLILGYIDPNEHLYTSKIRERKSGIASGQASMVTRAQKGPINILGLQGAGDRLKSKGSATQEEISPPAFPGGNHTRFLLTYTGIEGRRKKPALLIFALDASFSDKRLFPPGECCGKGWGTRPS